MAAQVLRVGHRASAGGLDGHELEAAVEVDGGLLDAEELTGRQRDARADVRVLIPMRPGLRSMNISVATGIVAAEALRQTGGWPS